MQPNSPPPRPPRRFGLHLNDCPYCACPDTLSLDDLNNAMRRIANVVAWFLHLGPLFWMRRRCSRCLLVFTPSLWRAMESRPNQSRCPNCGYDATQHTSHNCPECGFLLVHKLNEQTPIPPNPNPERERPGQRKAKYVSPDRR